MIHYAELVRGISVTSKRCV